MKLFPITATLIAAALAASGQNVVEEPKADPVLEAITEFSNQDKENAGETPPATVPEQPAAPDKETPPAAIAVEPKASPAEPVLVTGKPPEVVPPQTPPPAEASVEVPALPVAAPEEMPKTQQGLAVHIEKMKTGSGLVDPKKIKLVAPFPAKPLAKPPGGWHLVASENAPPFIRKVELAPGSEVTLTIRPHLLVPDSDGANVFSISESGYQPSLGYQQTATVGAILSNSIQQLENDSKQLGDAIDSLQQLLISLPKSEAAPAEPKPAVGPLPVRKR